jgi:hypothetical protein
MKIKKLRSFKVMGDDGKDYTLDVFNEILDTTTFSDEPVSSEEAGSRILKVGSMLVNRKSKGHYEFAGRTYVTDDPDAP